MKTDKVIHCIPDVQVSPSSTEPHYGLNDQKCVCLDCSSYLDMGRPV